jgi:hypothetical protein
MLTILALFAVFVIFTTAFIANTPCKRWGDDTGIFIKKVDN